MGGSGRPWGLGEASVAMEASVADWFSPSTVVAWGPGWASRSSVGALDSQTTAGGSPSLSMGEGSANRIMAAGYSSQGTGVTWCNQSMVGVLSSRNTVVG